MASLQGLGKVPLGLSGPGREPTALPPRDHDSDEVDKEALNSLTDVNRGDDDKKEGYVPELLDQAIEDPDKIIKTGADAAQHWLSDRDDGDPAITVRSMVLGTAFAAFYASISQIYKFKPTTATIGGSFICLIIWFAGRTWAAILPRGDRLEQRWKEGKHNEDSRLPRHIKIAKLLNPGPFGLKEHAVAAITASSASSGTASIEVFTTQNLYYSDNPLSPMLVILATLSIGLFGYGLTGLFRPLTVDNSEAVYWSQIPLLSLLQNLHWSDLRTSKRLRWFWYAFGFMAIYQIIPGYMFPWLNSVSIPCLASMHATGSKASILTNVFGGSLNNEGLGILNFSLDWQYITSFSTSLPLVRQANLAAGIAVGYIIMLAVYYGNAWGGRSLPFMSTRLLKQDGTVYDTSSVFDKGILNRDKLAQYGLPWLASTYTYGSIAGNIAIGALIGHCIFFWGGQIVRTIRDVRRGTSPDRHHLAMRRYKDTPWWWYVITLVIAFAFGLVVVLKSDVGLGAGGYVSALVIGTAIAPFSAILYSRFVLRIATNQLCKMLGGAIIPGHPLGNLYFTAWSHSVIMQSLNLAGDLKLGSYLKIPYRTMFLTQIWGTVFGAFINYVVMISIVNEHRDLLLNSNGSYAWSGAYFQSLNNQATTWALSADLYSAGGRYILVPVGLAIGFLIVFVHRIVVHYKPSIGPLDLRDINLPTFTAYTGVYGFLFTQTAPMSSIIASGLFVQYYLRNYRPRIYKEYSYLVTAALDGGSLLCIFVLSFAVFGAAGSQHPFPTWWGNSKGYPDYCPAKA